MPKIEALTSSDFEQRQAEPKILLFDIETSAAVGEFWSSPWQTNIIRIIQDNHMIGWSAKWLNGRQVTRALPDYEGYTPGTTDDSKLVAELRGLLDQADMTVGHNADRFDIPFTNGRMMVHGMHPVRRFKSYDTRKVAKSQFKLLSNKLDDILRILGLGRKLPIHYDTWEGCRAGDMKAWNRMKRYNAHDTKMLELVYLKFRAWGASHPNINLMLNRSAEGCPSCGSKETVKKGYNYTTTGKRQEYKCLDCGRRFSGRHQKISDFR